MSPAQRKEFWSRMSFILKEKYGISNKTKLKDKYGYQLKAFIQGIVKLYHEQNDPIPMVDCPYEGCEQRFTEKNVVGLNKHITVKHT